ncbi:hypothetical protein J2T13_002446 [Paenibacillus sp. DS2015]|uniref:hypothetical protein n=1 Tax=Paenibacillus sp. DS2015 TaxID=3373917 RepID=UPI003D19B6F4
MKLKFLSSLVAIVLVATPTFFSNPDSSYANESPERAPERVVQQYFTAMYEQDFFKAVSLVVDPRYPDKQKQIDKYKHYNEVSDFRNMKIISSDVEDNSTVTVTIEGNISGVNTQQELNLKEVEGEWKLLLGDGDEGTIKALNAPEISTRAVVDYYSFTGYNFNSPHYTINSFSTNGNNIVIKGWQNAGSSQHADVDYQIAQDTFWGWSTFGQPQNEFGNSTAGNTIDWYTKTFSGIAAGSDYHIRIVSWATSLTDGAGNVYTN